MSTVDYARFLETSQSIFRRLRGRKGFQSYCTVRPSVRSAERGRPQHAIPDSNALFGITLPPLDSWGPGKWILLNARLNQSDRYRALALPHTSLHRPPCPWIV